MIYEHSWLFTYCKQLMIKDSSMLENISMENETEVLYVVWYHRTITNWLKTWLTVMEYLCHKWPRICSTHLKHFPILSSFMTYQRMPLVEHELLILAEHLSSHPVVSAVRVTRSLVLYVCFVDRYLSFCPFFFPPLCCLLDS